MKNSSFIGWICPICSSIYSPSVLICYSCCKESEINHKEIKNYCDCKIPIRGDGAFDKICLSCGKYMDKIEI
jgi:hypothetical protein